MSFLSPNTFIRTLFSDDTNSPPVLMDWKETQNAHIYKFDLPGLSKDDVRIELHEDRVLKISGTSRDDQEEVKGEKWHLRERLIHTDSVDFSRQFRLPENANVDEIKASMSDGVLMISVPKDEVQKKKCMEGFSKRRKTVEIEGGEDEDGNATYGRKKGLGRFVCCKA